MVRWVRIMLGGHSSRRIKMNRRGCLSSTTSSRLPESETKLCDAPVSTKATVSRPFTVTPTCASPARLTHCPLNRIQQLPPLGRLLFRLHCIKGACEMRLRTDERPHLLPFRLPWRFRPLYSHCVLPSGLTNLFFDSFPLACLGPLPPVRLVAPRYLKSTSRSATTKAALRFCTFCLCSYACSQGCNPFRK